MIEKLKKMDRGEKIGHGLVWIFIILYFVFLYSLNTGIVKTPLLSLEGVSYVKAEVIEIISETRTEEGVKQGTQYVYVEIKSGEHKGEVIEASSIDSYLYGADCYVGTKVIVQLSEYEDSLSGSVYNYDRTNVLFGLIGLFLFLTILIGKAKGFRAILGLVFTFISIVYLYLPMMYIGYSPFFSAVVVVIMTTLATMYFIGGFGIKSLSAILGTVTGVVFAGLFATIFGVLGHIDGYNVTDIETLILIGQNSELQVGGLLFSGILIASLGAVMDVAMSISTSLEEIKYRKPEITMAEMFKSGIKIGGDMIGTMSNTLILAFTGGSLTTLVIYYAYDMAFNQWFNTYSMGIEILQSFAGSLGIVLTVPFVSFYAAFFFSHAQIVLEDEEFQDS